MITNLSKFLPWSTIKASRLQLATPLFCKRNLLLRMYLTYWTSWTTGLGHYCGMQKVHKGSHLLCSQEFFILCTSQAQNQPGFILRSKLKIFEISHFTSKAEHIVQNTLQNPLENKSMNWFILYFQAVYSELILCIYGKCALHLKFYFTSSFHCCKVINGFFRRWVYYQNCYQN